MQRARKSGSSSAPGGRSRRSLRLLPRPVLARSSGTATAPAAMPGQRPAPSQIGRCHFDVRLRPEEAELEHVLRATAHAVHAHLALRFAPRRAAMGSSPPWQCSRQRLQLLQASGSLSSPRTDQRETTPSSAPSGQSDAAPEARDAQAGTQNHKEQECPGPDALRKVRLPEFEHQRAQHRVHHSARGFDHGNVAVLQRLQRRAHRVVERRQKRQARSSAPAG